MLRGYRLAIIALGLTLALGAQAQSNPDQPEAETGESGAQQQWPPLPLPVQIVEEQAEKHTRESIEKEARQREIDDLAAQRGMNEASQRMADAADIQTWIVGFGTALVLATLLVTVFANKAAFKMVDITERASQRQLRAYVFFEAPVFITTDPGERMEIAVPMRNYGQTPAFHATGFCSFDIAPYPLPEDYVFGEKNAVGSREKNYLAPSQTKYLHACAETNTTDDDWATIRAARERRLYIYGCVDYTDAFNIKHTTRFCYCCDETSVSHGYYKTMNVHNDAT
jgi:hypothetical protein